ncbi:hypothetical protein [Nocardioides sp. AE5]|uniref:hypothetical protein n=1 Tax=Nocardioides sp. AE5 TaxID=2962573 RepID=UPI002881E0E9|nr:hypothetical protein [Nocardioides sp. AE5]MDT0202188.1 hypothetical protein [Nocardioides sp. AE5]
MTPDAVLTRLAEADPASYLLQGPPTGPEQGWHRSAALREASVWPGIARAYAAGIGSTSLVVGGSCALQGYAGRVAALSVGRWALTGRGLPLADLDTGVRLADGRTVGIWVPAFDEAMAPCSPAGVAEHLVAHLEGILTASRTVSRITEKVAWGNVAAAVAGAWRRAHDGVAPASRPDVRRAAVSCLAAPVWPWASVPISWEAVEAPWGESLAHRRHTCCLIRLAPEKRACASCSDLGEDEVRSRWQETLAGAAPKPLELVSDGAQ